MKLSIVIPVYNVEEYLIDCVDSIVNQDNFQLSNNNIEIILINDGSTDNSQVLIDRYANKFSFVQSFFKVNGGLSDARNYGLSKASGDYIWFIDSDDWISKDSLSVIFNELERNDNLDILEFDYISSYPNGYRKIDNYYSSIHTKKILLGRDFIQQYGYSICACNKVISLSFLKEVNCTFPLNRYSEDNLFCLKLFLYANSVKKIQNNIYFYRRRSNSITNKKDSEHLKKYMSDILYNISQMMEIASKEKFLIRARIKEMCYFLSFNILITTIKYLDFNFYKSMVKSLNTIGVYPIGVYQYHNSRKRKIFNIVINNYWLSFLFNYIYRFKELLRGCPR